MELKEYQNQAKRTNAPMPNHYGNMTSLHMLMGMSTEVGELTDPFKKNLAYGKEIDWINVEEEVADLMWYIVNFCECNGIDLPKILDRNIEKLQARYPEKFTTENAINRNLEVERKILEK